MSTAQLGGCGNSDPSSDTESRARLARAFLRPEECMHIFLHSCIDTHMRQCIITPTPSNTPPARPKRRTLFRQLGNLAAESPATGTARAINFRPMPALEPASSKRGHRIWRWQAESCAANAQCQGHSERGASPGTAESREQHAPSTWPRNEDGQPDTNDAARDASS